MLSEQAWEFIVKKKDMYKKHNPPKKEKGKNKNKNKSAQRSTDETGNYASLQRQQDVNRADNTTEDNLFAERTRR